MVWAKGKKVTLKNPPSRMFREYFTGRPYLRDTREIDNVAQLFNFQLVLFMWLIRRLASREIHLIFNYCSILHQLNTKLNTIKFHKIQENNL